ncbi:hypothetical protein GCM10027180_12080 [Microbulbifer echini]
MRILNWGGHYCPKEGAINGLLGAGVVLEEKTKRAVNSQVSRKAVSESVASFVLRYRQNQRSIREID